MIGFGEGEDSFAIVASFGRGNDHVGKAISGSLDFSNGFVVSEILEEFDFALFLLGEKVTGACNEGLGRGVSQSWELGLHTIRF